MSETREVPAEQVYRAALTSELAGDVGRANSLYEILNSQSAFAKAAVNYSVNLAEAGQFEAGAALLEHAFRRLPEDPAISACLSQALLRLGRFERGWLLHERRTIHINRHVVGKPKLSFPEWGGEPVRSLVILPEQGLGDQIMFARYAAELRAEGVDVTLICDPLLVRLFEQLGVSVLPAAGTIDVPKSDAWAMMMSLPIHRRTTISTISGAPYLRGAPGGAGIGVRTAGNPTHSNDAKRSLPAEFAAELLSLSGAVDLAPTPSTDLLDTAKFISKLSLVITVDTAVAHLAGAMGKPTWVLLPYYPDWRWFLDRADSPWYGSMRLFRQPSPGDWSSVMSDVRKALG